MPLEPAATAAATEQAESPQTGSGQAGARPRAAYVHVPFCARRCGYCNFTLVAGRSDLVEPYLAALERELEMLGGPLAIETLFFGGGTPTQLEPDALRRLLELVRQHFVPSASAEISVEANPADLTAEKVALLADYGVNRLSLGAQSFDADKLRVLQRDHRREDIRRAVATARPRIRSLSLDLIFGVPGETLDTWRSDLEAAVALEVDHLSTYGLTFEKGTAFYAQRLRGELAEPGEEVQAQQYCHAIDRLAAAGFEHYEVSNFARPGHRCRHNEVYWAGEFYEAAGPGAARYVGFSRQTNHRSVFTWLKRLQEGQSPVAQRETLSPEDRAREALVLALRRCEGIDRAAFVRRFGYQIDQLAGPQLKQWTGQGLVLDRDGRVRFTRAGLLVSDALWPEVLRV